jgi:hypothetical protein
MSIEDTEAIGNRFIAIFNEQNPAIADEIFAPSCEFPTESRPIGQLLCTNLIKCMGNPFCQSLPNAANEQHSMNYQKRDVACCSPNS